jgi:hypothetical protein
VNLTWTRASGLVAAALLISAAAPGCRRQATNDAPSSASSAPAAAPAPKPVDAVLPGELAEGAEKAFGLPIPRRMQVRGTYKDEVIAAGQVPAEQLANYVRQRVLAESVETGPAKTVFTRATVKSAPQRMLRIEVVARRGGGTELIVRDQTRPPPEPGLTDVERWREKGLNPDGSPIDPTRLE